MFLEQRVGVVIPHYRSLSATLSLVRDLPAWVDQVVVVDDCSEDGSPAALRRAVDPSTRAGQRLQLIAHPKRLGRGRAVVTGYRTLLAEGLELCVVAWPGEAVDPSELEQLIQPVAEHAADIVTGSHLGKGGARLRNWRGRLAARLLGQLLHTEGAPDSGCCHHALSGVAMRRLPLSELARGEGFTLDLLIQASRVCLVAKSVNLRPLARPRRTQTARTLWLLGRAALVRFRRPRAGKVLPANARARAKVAAARLINGESRQRQLP